MEEQIVNRVAKSNLITFDLEEYFDKSPIEVLDIKDWLYQEIILKEKEFRLHVKEHDWSKYDKVNLAVHCSAEAIVPVWAYMLIVIHAEPYAKNIVLGDRKDLNVYLFNKALDKVDIEKYRDSKIVIKGCSKHPVPEAAYIEITKLLRPVASSIMYGEPCSTVPLFKNRKK